MSKQVVEAAEALVAALDRLIADSGFQSAFVMAHIHGMPYNGPQIGEELERLRAALAASEKAAS